MGLADWFKSKEEKKLNKARLQLERLKIRTYRQRLKNSLATSKANSEIRKIEKTGEKLETISDIKAWIEENMPTQKHWVLEALEKPEVQGLVTKFITGQGGIDVSDREKVLHQLMSEPEVQQTVMKYIGKKE